MTQIIEVPGSLEGRKIQLKGLKITPQGRPQKRKGLGLVFPFTIKRDGEGIIKKELEPKQFKIKATSLLNIGDSISGKHLWGFATSPIKPGQIQKGGVARTAGHTGQNLLITGKCCFLQLIHGFRGLPTTEHPKILLNT